MKDREGKKENENGTKIPSPREAKTANGQQQAAVARMHKPTMFTTRPFYEPADAGKRTP